MKDKCFNKKTHCEFKLKNVCPKFPIKKVPFVIDKPGYYFLKKDLVYTNTTNAITINSSNVIIDFCQHTLTLTNFTDFATGHLSGIFVNGTTDNPLHNIDILGPTIISSASVISAVGVWFENASRLSVKNGYFRHLGIGVFNFPGFLSEIINCRFEINIGDDTGTTNNAYRGVCCCQNSSDILIENCSFLGRRHTLNYAAWGIEVTQLISNNVIVRDCDFTTLDTGVFAFLGENLLIEDCNIRDVPFYPTGSIPAAIVVGSDGGGGGPLTQYNNVTIRNVNVSTEGFGINFLFSDNVLLENINILRTTADSQAVMMQLGGTASSTGMVKNVVARNINFNGEQANAEAAALLLLNGNTALFENVTIRSNFTSFNAPAALIIGSEALGFFPFNNVVFKNLQLTGQNADGIIISTSNVRIEDSQISGAIENIIDYGDTNITIKNCDVQGPAELITPGNPNGESVGIDFEGTTCSSLISNEVRNNGFASIFLGGTDSVICKDNDIYCNASPITDNGTNDQLVNNQQFSNPMTLKTDNEKHVELLAKLKESRAKAKEHLRKTIKNKIM